MTLLTKKVLWSEGILLSQQHFQQFERYIDARMQALQKLSFRSSWGIKEMIVDRRLLCQGVFSVSSLCLLMPSGQWVSLSEKEDEISSLELEDDINEIYFNLPDNKKVCHLKGYPQYEASSCGWRVSYEDTKDCLDAAREKEVIFIKPNGYLALKPLEKRRQSMKIARVVKRHGGYELDESYIPPILLTSVSTHYQDKLNAIQAALYHAMELLSDNEQPEKYHNKQLIKVVMLRLTAFLTLVINKGRAHPEEVFDCLHQGLIELDQLMPVVGHLALNYLHHDIYGGLETIVNKLSDIVSYLSYQQGERLILEKTQNGLFVLDDIDRKLFNKSWRIKILTSDTHNSSRHINFQQIKVSTKRRIHQLIKGSLPGINLIEESHSRYTYRIDKNDKAWEEICESRSMAVFVADEIVESIVLLLQS